MTASEAMEEVRQLIAPAVPPGDHDGVVLFARLIRGDPDGHRSIEFVNSLLAPGADAETETAGKAG